ncbi:uncharacterized protein si:dkeyp-75h12.7 [Ictalurus punctatus]|uniref:Uncharacterized protein si:dkeyp-75h12.7 n=1 Tax=Ictalurus punctatus TaxID=7998 RepID=A0A2D0RBZ8_ICTPU|nr:uncharacterized protein si:dkeyp-75h12.7 [Ictalurus punctatus]XP_017328069.1 uncharacterized protein si:dkeyp-75h12.7 [Ictalurus punctatus]XP_017328071.1 uncharacterized protein si:dkeyp-75h12.7 [Ictalurus punctatus]
MWAVPLILSVMSLVLYVGSSFSSCTTSVRVQDLRCYMNWSCSDVTSTNATFTVQSKRQGEEWENVSHCLQITSDSCDLSEVFDDFYLYNFVRLGLNQGHGKINWTLPQLCDPVKGPNMSFSAPSLSLSLKEQQLWVEVIFQCAPNAVCQTLMEGYDEHTPICCALGLFLTLNATVTLYNKHDMNDIQTRTEIVEDSRWKVPFVVLASGQEYCAVAQLGSSPVSNPQCIYVPLLVTFLLAPCGVFIALLLVVGFVLRRWGCWCVSTDLRLPKVLMSLQSQDQEGSVVDEPSQPTPEEEESIVHLSFISLNSMLPFDSESVYPHLQSPGVSYYTTALLQGRFCDGNEDIDYLSSDVETDCAFPDYYPWPRWSSLPALRTGMVCLLGNFLPSEGIGIPLSSVRVAGAQIA